jgi:hypothetical protein
MTKRCFLLVTATIIGILLVATFIYTFSLATRADFGDAEWQLTVTGLVDHPLNLTLSEIAAMPQTTIYAQIYCVDFPNSVVTEGNWTGVKLSLLLEEAGVYPDAVKVAFYAKDGYSTDLTLAAAERNDTILAYEKDGAPLGETLRLVVPDRWGYKWISQVTRIEFVNYDFKGFWESRGYSDDASIQSGGVLPETPAPPFSPPYINLPSPLPSTSPSPIPSNSSNPNTSNSSSLIPSQTPDPKSDQFLPMNATYAIAAVIVIMLFVAAVVVFKKRAKQKTFQGTWASSNDGIQSCPSIG